MCHVGLGDSNETTWVVALIVFHPLLYGDTLLVNAGDANT
jgi:hypothetical protein